MISPPTAKNNFLQAWALLTGATCCAHPLHTMLAKKVVQNKTTYSFSELPNLTKKWIFKFFDTRKKITLLFLISIEERTDICKSFLT